MVQQAAAELLQTSGILRRHDLQPQVDDLQGGTFVFVRRIGRIFELSESAKYFRVPGVSSVLQHFSNIGFGRRRGEKNGRKFFDRKIVSESAAVHVGVHPLDVVVVIVVVAVVVVVIVVVVDRVDDVGHGVDGDEEESQERERRNPCRGRCRTLLEFKIPIGDLLLAPIVWHIASYRNSLGLKGNISVN